jgi:cytochrome c peroxidase
VASNRRVAAIIAVALFGAGCSEPIAPQSPPFEPGEVRLLESLSLANLKAPPESKSNAVAQDVRAARLGERLFFDPGLSVNGKVACATCHRPELHFTDGKPTSTGIGTAFRNAPSVVGAAYSPFLFWDGRRDSLWSQALVPIEAPTEMGASRLEVVRYVTGDARYADDYESIFGPAPHFNDTDAYPPHASPYGDAARRSLWAALPEQARDAVNRAFSNVGKAIGAYQRQLRPTPTRFDLYVDRLVSGDIEGASVLFDDHEVAGLRLFLDVGRTQCLRCHNGPLLTNQAFHDVDSGRLGAIPDLGRFPGVESLLLTDFNCLGPYSDASPEACRELRFLDRRESARATGAFKTPSLRELARTAPYFHNGSLETLQAVIDHYRHVDDSRGSEITRLDLTDSESIQLVAFLHTLSGRVAADRRTD